MFAGYPIYDNQITFLNKGNGNHGIRNIIQLRGAIKITSPSSNNRILSSTTIILRHMVSSQDIRNHVWQLFLKFIYIRYTKKMSCLSNLLRTNFVMCGLSSFSLYILVVILMFFKNLQSGKLFLYCVIIFIEQ